MDRMICLYTSKKLDENHYSLTVDIRNHKGLGKYNVHVYGETKTGNLIKLGMSEFLSIIQRLEQ